MTLSMDTLTKRDSRTDPKIWDNKIKFPQPEYTRGLLAESWEQPDLATAIIHVRKGVRWQDKAPMNGRELTAYDIEFHYQRMYGLGSGYTKPTPNLGLGGILPGLVSVTATDKYTVVFKIKSPSTQFLPELLDPLSQFSPIAPPDAVKQYGDVNDWKRVVGTGPFFTTDYVSGSSLTFNKNPNYWDFDERYPENKLPYADTVKILIIPDTATALAALRTGKIDFMGGLTLEQAKSLGKTNPELLQITRPALWGDAVGMRVDKAPFTDIRVRKALQMAVDLKSIATNFYGGAVDATPVGYISPFLPGYYVPYNEWAPEVQAGYTYNPDGAKKLLAEAGFPNGFKTNMVVSAASDQDLWQIIKSYFTQIGVDMEIRVMDSVSYTSFTRAMKHDALTSSNCALALTPSFASQWRNTGNAYNILGVSDPVFDDISKKAINAIYATEYKKLIREEDYQAIKQQWAVNILPKVVFCIYQPWFKGYSGWTDLRGSEFARFWIDQNVKTAMGH